MASTIITRVPFRILWNDEILNCYFDDEGDLRVENGFIVRYGHDILLNNTGQQDRNRKDIFVGDVFRRKTGEYAVVEFVDGRYYLVTKNPNEQQKNDNDVRVLLKRMSINKLEIIGNSWELGIYR
ncbi:hypothetical protein JCM16163A_49990 [Paenibacillus sp. YK5]